MKFRVQEENGRHSVAGFIDPKPNAEGIGPRKTLILIEGEEEYIYKKTRYQMENEEEEEKRGKEEFMKNINKEV